ncbi:DUF6415 family natural product biosynthesis protein [Streptomyces sp. DH12]|uniref:DUF6415 family natural product biosynthesis protein n=1 Tax=Streptomyces sp. DH12 TaxID=2857010 RepID=UPI001E404884|nr:DUF6415 family natural product biosynthesis protein [Streptomyces sp. DH12]
MTAPAARRPLDTETMRDVARRLLDPHAEVPTEDAAETLALTCRGMLMLLIPAVEDASHRLTVDAPPRVLADAGVFEARARLGHQPGGGLPARIAHAQRLARSVLCLLDHLTGPTTTP